jgi:uncharacterized protein (TIGR04255 family)
MKKSDYKRPPITEAVIGINFATPIPEESLQKASDRFAKHYPQHHAVQNFTVAVAMINGKPNTGPLNQELGHRRNDVGMTELLVLWRSEFTLSQLAPYPGWEAFIGRFARDWKIWKRAAPRRDIVRVGVRFINRIDIPVNNGKVEYEKYLAVYPKLPSLYPAIDVYAMQARIPLDGGCHLTLNSAAVPSPIIGHNSFVLDLDIAKDQGLPQNDADLLQLMNQIRKMKNDVFESFITNRARKLFNNA